MSKKIREKRQFRLATAGRSSFKSADEAEAFLKNFDRQLQLPLPAAWPGACDASLARPDLVKLEYAKFALGEKLGHGQLRQLQRALASGPLEDIPELDHWAMEEFLWHGLPGASWSPLEAFLAQAGERFSPQAGEQLRLWQQARFGFYEIGPVTGDLVTLREWNPITRAGAGPGFRAIALNIGGVNFYRQHLHGIQIIYVAPWSPEEELEGTPDLVLEVVSKTSVRKDTVVLRELYWKAGIAEYWIVDVRDGALSFEILQVTAEGYVAATRADGWISSKVLGKKFQLQRKTDPLGHPQFVVAAL